MSQVCSKCSHANPPEAVYCYFDGVMLGGHSANGGPVRAGSQPFPSQFVFPTGQACRNFDQLAVACQQNWSSAVDLLQQGYLASFLGGIGRADLALAAQEAARFPDRERGLDQLLAKLPTQVLDPPKLNAEPTNVNLGVLPLGTNRSLELHLSNRGMRLLYGSVVSDCKWLTLGDAPGNPQKLFQFGAEAVIPVQVRGQHLRAGNKPLEGHLIVESNGGSVTLTVRAEVPARPYPDGVLAGATTPRQIAEKAHAAPKEAAALFESGAVARWFGDNGWTYPVQGPSASGVGAVQQFFEALGLSKAPKVEISQQSLSLRGNVGEAITATLEVKTQEKRPVYAHAICDQPWLDVGKAVLSGRSAVVQVVVPYVPMRPGETLQAMVTVTANGNQRFQVPVSLQIGGSMVYPVQALPVTPGSVPVVFASPAQAPNPVAALPAIPILVAEVAPAVPVAYAAPPPAPPTAPARPAMVAAIPVATTQNMVTATPVASAPFVPIPIAAPPAPPQPTGPPKPLIPPAALRWAGLIAPTLLLAFILFIVLVRDLIWGPAVGDDNIPIDTEHPKVMVQFDSATGSMRFGITDKDDRKLTYDKTGRTNSTVLRIDKADVMFGNPTDGQWITMSKDLQYGGKESVWVSSRPPGSKIQVTQIVEVIPGEPVEYSAKEKGKLKRFLDTVSVRYRMENKGNADTLVGLRMLLDTLIGDNDGAPFIVPGRSGLVDKMEDFKQAKQIPDFVQVLERGDMKDPGIVAFLNLKLGGGVEAPDRVQLTQWPGIENLGRWTIDMRPIDAPVVGRDVPDSAVVMTWNPKFLKPGEKREVGFAYGLGGLSVSNNGHLGVNVGGSFTPGGSMTVIALVTSPAKGETLELKVPPGLRLLGDARQTVPPVAADAAVQQSPVTWHIQAEREGTFTIEVHSSTNVTQRKTIKVKAERIFSG
jgi:hypothetical protein